MNEKIIICIPGMWKNYQDLVHSILENNKGYIYAGKIIKSLDSEQFAEVEEWLNFSSESIVDLFKAFVIILRDRNTLLSCGMQNFGHPDGIITLEAEYPGYTLETFLIYIIGENPKIMTGQTFAPEKDMEMFAINLRLSSDFYGSKELFFNPHNFWELCKV